MLHLRFFESRCSGKMLRSALPSTQYPVIRFHLPGIPRNHHRSLYIMMSQSNLLNTVRWEQTALVSTSFNSTFQITVIRSTRNCK